MAIAATIHMALLGGEGLERVAAACVNNTQALTQRLVQIEGVEPVFNRPVFHERVLCLPVPAKEVLERLSARNILGGLDLYRDYPELGDAVLVCATEKRTGQEMDDFQQKLKLALQVQ